MAFLPPLLHQPKLKPAVYTIECPWCQCRVSAVAEHNQRKRFFFCSGCFYAWEAMSDESLAPN
jgi:hypothetical protein